MEFDMSNKFVGPMSVDVFLQEFIPGPRGPVPRPGGALLFSQSTISQNLDDFVSASLRFVRPRNVTTVRD